MCRKELSEGAKACALKTRFYFDDMRAAARIAAELLPCGKMLLIADEETQSVKVTVTKGDDVSTKTYGLTGLTLEID